MARISRRHTRKHRRLSNRKSKKIIIRNINMLRRVRTRNRLGGYRFRYDTQLSTADAMIFNANTRTKPSSFRRRRK